MYKGVVFVALAIAVAQANKCHVSDGPDELNCGKQTQMNCNAVDYIPYCHQITNSNTNLNGVCSCEKLCFVDGDCATGCSNGYTGRCREAYSNSIEKICVCVRN